MKYDLLKPGLVLLSSLSLAACGTLAVKPQSTTGKLIGQTLQQAQQHTAPPVSEQQVMQELIPPAEAPASVAPEARFDVKVNRVRARAFFFGLVQDTAYNVVLAPGLGGRISLNLKNVTVPRVMDIVRNVYGYEYTLDQGIYTVLPVAPRTEIFPFDYINLKRIGHSQTRVNSGQVTNTSGRRNSTAGGNNSPSQRNSTGNQSRSGGGSLSRPSSSDIETTTDTDVWKEVEQTLKILVADSKGAQVKVSPQAGAIVVRANPRDLRLVRGYLHVSEENLSRQVILEAKILEVTLNRGHQAGIDWKSFGSINGNNVLNMSQTGQAVLSNSNNDPLQGVFSLLYKKNDFNAVIELLNTQGDTHVLSSPRVSTLNNQKAVIKVGTDEFFVTDVSTTTVAGAATSTITPDVTLTPFFSGIALDVTPQIDRDGRVILHVHPSVSNVKDQTKVIKLGDSNFTLPLALSSIRESDSIVRTRSGQVVVIGGLMQQSEKITENSTPLLGSIPVLGTLFRQTKKSLVKSELVILLRAQVVQPDTWSKEVEKTTDRFKELNKGS